MVRTVIYQPNLTSLVPKWRHPPASYYNSFNWPNVKHFWKIGLLEVSRNIFCWVYIQVWQQDKTKVRNSSTSQFLVHQFYFVLSVLVKHHRFPVFIQEHWSVLFSVILSKDVAFGFYMYIKVIVLSCNADGLRTSKICQPRFKLELKLWNFSVIIATISTSRRQGVTGELTT